MSASKEDINFLLDLINTYPVASTVTGVVFGFMANYGLFWKGIISIPSHTKKMATLETLVSEQKDTIDNQDIKIKVLEERQKRDHEASLEELRKLRARVMDGKDSN